MGRGSFQRPEIWIFFDIPALTLAKLLAHLGTTFLFIAGLLTHFELPHLTELVAHLGISSEEGG
jgi:hypothetical protein